MVDRRANRDTVVLPFTVGMLIGGVVTGWIICIHLGRGSRLIGLASSGSTAFIVWIVDLFLSVTFASLLAIATLAFLRLLAGVVRFSLMPRFSYRAMVALGIVAVSASAVASCLTLGSWLAKDLGSPKGSRPAL